MVFWKYGATTAEGLLDFKYFSHKHKTRVYACASTHTHTLRFKMVLLEEQVWESLKT